MMSTKTGGIFLLQECEPRRLIASLVSHVTDASLGLIRIAFYSEPSLFEWSRVEGRASLVIDSAVAVSFAGLLQILVAQSRWMRGAGGAATGGLRTPAELTVRREPGRKGRTACAWLMPTDGVALIDVADSGGQLELQLREDMAQGIAGAIVDELGRFSASDD